MARPRPPILPEHKAALLEKVGGWRRECQAIQASAPINGSVYWAVGALMSAIDGVAEATTGVRQYFWTQANNALEGDRSKGSRSTEAVDTSDGSAR